LFADTVDARVQIREAVVAVGIRDRTQMRGAIDGVQKDGPARQARLARIVHTIPIRVLELLAREPSREIRIKCAGCGRREGLEEITGSLL
jgi:hypothetical protein